MSQKAPYIGSTISLVSKLNIRYEGILYSVNSAESTIALAKVRSFGTENRATLRPVPMRNDIYDCIIFKASDIKNLVVCETPKQEISQSRFASNYRFSQQYENYQQRNSGGLNNNTTLKQQFVKDRLKFDSDYDFEKANKQFQQTISGLGLDLQNLNLENVRNQEKNAMSVEEIENQNKKTLTAEDNNEKKKSTFFYDKNTSFFDCISCETLEKEEGKNIRPDWKKERQTNQETFGHSAVRLFAYRRGGRGGNYKIGIGRNFTMRPNAPTPRKTFL